MSTLHDAADCRQLAQWLAAARSAVVFTGAGMSTESGIPDFRSPGGVWATSQPVYFDQFLASPAARHEYWRQKAVAHRDFAASRPNVGHLVLARWESRGLIRCVVTQNIDGLHQQAGSRRVLELHGTARQVGCLSCGRRDEAAPYVEQFLAAARPPDCPACGGLLKHATVSFGQPLPADVLDEAVSWCRQADLLLAVGSSLVVEPAASLPRLAARLVIINHQPTPLDSLAAAVIRQSIGETLATVDRLLADELARS